MTTYLCDFLKIDVSTELILIKNIFDIVIQCALIRG